MAKHSLRLLELARKGAIHRYHELKAELSDLIKAFPRLEFGSAVSPNVPPISMKRRPVRMSAAARRAIGAAQRARWARLKAARNKSPKKRRGMSPAARKAASVRMKAYWAKRRSAK